jgi:RNA binding exosome subunit
MLALPLALLAFQPSLLRPSTAHDVEDRIKSRMELPDKQRALQIFDQLDEKCVGQSCLWLRFDKGIVMLLS